MEARNLALSAEELVGINTSSLADMQPTEKIEVEESALHFDTTDYTPLEAFAEAIRSKLVKLRRSEKFAPKKYVSLASLKVNGGVKREPMDNYLANEALSSSLLKQALISPRHYYIAKHMPITPKSTKHFELGTFAHSAILEPSKFDKVMVEPAVNRATKDGLRELIEFYYTIIDAEQEELISMGELRGQAEKLRGQAEKEGCTFIDGHSAQLVNIMRQTCATYAGGIIKELMKYAKKEISIYGVDPSTGLDVKIRPDAMLFEEDFGINVIVSVKTTSALTPDAFLRDCAKYRYEVSEGMYLDVASNVMGRKFSGTLMIVMQTAAPYQMFMLWWDAEDLQIGKYKYYHAMQTIKECTDSGVYKGFDSLAEEGHFGIIKGKLPNYIKSELPPQYVGDNYN